MWEHHLEYTVHTFGMITLGFYIILLRQKHEDMGLMKSWWFISLTITCKTRIAKFINPVHDETKCDEFKCLMPKFSTLHGTTPIGMHFNTVSLGYVYTCKA